MSRPPVAARNLSSERASVTSEVVFGYKPPQARSRMMASDQTDDDDMITDDDAPNDGHTYAEVRTIKVTIGEIRKAVQRQMGR